jgi:hypothetical protein
LAAYLTIGTAACIKAVTNTNKLQFFFAHEKFKKFENVSNLSVALEQRENLTKIALKLTEYLYRTYLSPSTWSTPCAPDSKHNNALYLPPALILPLRCRHGAGVRTERGGLQTKKKIFSRLGAAYGVRAPSSS